MTSLVLGAGGFLGLNLVDALQLGGHSFVCGTRRAAPRISLRRRGVTLEHADLDDVESLVQAMRGKRVVFHLAGHYPALSVDPQATMAHGLRQMKSVLDAAVQAQVSRLVYVSSTATTAAAVGRASTEADVFSQAPGLGVYHDLKWAMEHLAMNETRLEVRVACPGACLGPWDQRIGTTAPLVALANGRKIALPNGTLNLVDVRDAAAGIVAMGVQSAAPSRALLVGHNLLLGSFLAQVASRYGVETPTLLSDQQARELADAEERRSEITGQRPALSRELVDLIVEGNPIDASLSEDALGLTYRTVEQTLQAFEQWARTRRIVPNSLEITHDDSHPHPSRPRPDDPVGRDSHTSQRHQRD